MDIPNLHDLAYTKIFAIEKAMRDNMYSENNQDYLEPTCNLIRVRELFPLLTDLDKSLTQPLYPDDVLFIQDEKTRGSLRFPQSQSPLIIAIARQHVCIAGGWAYAALTDNPYKDIDVFIYGCAESRARDITNDIVRDLNSFFDYDRLYQDITSRLGEKGIFSFYTEVIRSQNAFTITRRLKTQENRYANPQYYSVFQVQIILRLYQTVSEVLHGFDVDCCCAGLVNSEFWVTQRCFYALIRGYNTVNLELSSPSYTSRLLKYTERGMAVRVPQLAELTKDVRIFELEPRDVQAKVSELKLNGLAELVIASWLESQNLKYVRPQISDYDVNIRSAGWARPIYHLGRNMVKMSQLSVDEKRQMLWVFSRWFTSSLYIDEDIIRPGIEFLRSALPELNPGLDCCLALLALPMIGLESARGILDKILFNCKEITITYGNVFESDADSQAFGNQDPDFVMPPRTKLRWDTYVMTRRHDQHRVRLLVQDGQVVATKHIIYGDNPNLFQSIFVADVFPVFNKVIPWSFPEVPTFKITNPGEQMTCTFNPYDEQQRAAWLDMSELTKLN